MDGYDFFDKFNRVIGKKTYYYIGKKNCKLLFFFIDRLRIFEKQKN